ncbi:hypothetical protein GCM10027200_48180 [Lentzea nigeriaca]
MSEPDLRLMSTGKLLSAVVDEVAEIRVRDNVIMRKIVELERRFGPPPDTPVFTRMSGFVEEGQCLPSDQ